MRFRKLFALGMALTCLQAPLWADSYMDVEYRGGAPEFSTHPVQGMLRLSDGGVNFTTGAGQTLEIPLTAIREQGYQTRSQNRGGRGFAFVGPNPVMMAVSLGVSALGNVVARPRTQHEYFYRINYETADGRVNEVLFRVPDEGTQTALMDEIRAINRKYNTGGLHVVQQQPLEPSLNTVLEPPPGMPMRTVLDPVSYPDAPINVLYLEEGPSPPAEAP